jgi:hypothetical protein
MCAKLTGKLETERKFDVGLDFALPDLRDLGGSARTESAPPEVERLIARYYDTDDLRLAAAGVTLRRRTGAATAAGILSCRSAHKARGARTVGDGDEPGPGWSRRARRSPGGRRALRPVATLETTRTVRRSPGQTADSRRAGRRR